MKFLVLSVALVAMGFGSGCNSTPSAQAVASTTACTDCSAITPENFVSALVALAQSGKINASYANTTITKDPSLQPGTFVIWDGATQNYMAVTISTSYNGCTGGNGCTDSNPQAAALAFANAGVQTHYGPSTENQEGDIVNNPNGTDIGNSFGTNTYPLNDGESGDYYTATAGGVVGINLLANGQSDAAGRPVFIDTYGDGELYSQNTATRDTDLQQANLQQSAFVKRAATISASFQMDFQKAVQLTSLSDKLAVISAQGQALSSDDRASMMQTLSGIAGVTSSDLTTAVTAALQGNNQPTNDLVEAIAKNLGMPSSASLKGQILPQLGIDLN